MSVRAAFGKWAVLGGLLACLLLAAQASAVDGVEGLLQVGESNTLRPIIESELGDVPLQPDRGHDGQIYYAMALDLDGDKVAQDLDHDLYRYRRIVYPVLSSAFGLLDGRPLLYGMLTVTVISSAAAAGAVAAMARLQRRSDWWALAVVLNPGVWLSVRLLTADVTALALMLLGLQAFSRASGLPTVAAFALSGLTKEVYLITPVALARHRTRLRWLTAVIPVVTVVAWTLWLTTVMGDGFGPRGNLTWPFEGILDSWTNWSSVGLEDRFYLAFALLSIGGGLVFGITRNSWLRWPILGWSALGIVSSHAVWDFGNNSARAFAPILVIVALGGGQSLVTAGVDRWKARPRRVGN